MRKFFLFFIIVMYLIDSFSSAKGSTLCIFLDTVFTGKSFAEHPLILQITVTRKCCLFAFHLSLIRKRNL